MRKSKAILMVIVVSAIAGMLYAYYLNKSKHSDHIGTPQGSGVPITNMQTETDGEPVLITNQKDKQNKPLAGFYKWKDEQGVIHYTNDMEKVPEKFREQLKPVGGKVVKMDEKQLEQTIEDAREKENSKKDPQVTVFISSNCPLCEQSEMLLKQIQIPYKICNIDRDLRCSGELKDLNDGKTDVPFIHSPTGTLAGYKPEMIKRHFMQ